jgi:Fe-S cluster assembly ATP-binding protein
MEVSRVSDQQSILEVRNVGMELGGQRILDDLSMSFHPGHVHAVVGPNGAGKSTLASAIMGLSGYTDHSGEILFQGEKLNRLSVDQRARRGISMAWQEPARFEGLSLSRFVTAGARDRSEKSVRRVLELVGLEPDRYLDRAVDRTLSGGERKRIEIASLLAMEPALVIMDEPDSGIDVDALNRIFESIGHLKRTGTTVLLITHSLTVLQHADHAFLICCGRLIDKGPVKEIASYFDRRCIPCDHRNRPSLGEA